ncbi:MAG: BrnT family toxin [Candidatus Margulisiibacteriota bacterium]
MMSIRKNWGQVGIFALDYLLICSYDKTMKIEFDPVKSERNTKLRSLSFDRAVDFDWEDAFIIADTRKTYPEGIFVAVGYLNCRLHVLCFTPIKDGIRVISFRKANRREALRHEKPLAIDE